MDAPSTSPRLPRDPLAELLEAARYAAEYLSPCPPTEGKPAKAGLILAAAIHRVERHLGAAQASTATQPSDAPECPRCNVSATRLLALRWWCAMCGRWVDGGGVVSPASRSPEGSPPRGE